MKVSLPEKLLRILFTLFLSVTFFLIGSYVSNRKTSTWPGAFSCNNQNLLITGTQNDTGYFNVYPLETTYKTESLFSVLNFDDVKITINGHSIDIGVAIENCYISVDELSLYARNDSRNGYCKETYRIQDGLTEFIYTYPNFEFCIIYDVQGYDPNLTKIENYLLCRPGDHKSITHSFKNRD